ncbi:MAG: TMEM14 family protein [Fimbriimonadaceae bacterium]
MRVVVVVYGVINILGGLMGFLASGSVASLVVGVLSGLLLIGAGAIAGPKPALGYRAAGILTLLLVAFWIYRIGVVVGQDKSPMMAVMNLVLAAAVFLALGLGHLMAVRKRKSEEPGPTEVGG